MARATAGAGGVGRGAACRASLDPDELSLGNAVDARSQSAGSTVDRADPGGFVSLVGRRGGRARGGRALPVDGGWLRHSLPMAGAVVTPCGGDPGLWWWLGSRHRDHLGRRHGVAGAPVVVPWRRPRRRPAPVVSPTRRRGPRGGDAGRRTGRVDPVPGRSACAAGGRRWLAPFGRRPASAGAVAGQARGAAARRGGGQPSGPGSLPGPGRAGRVPSDRRGLVGDRAGRARLRRRAPVGSRFALASTVAWPPGGAGRLAVRGSVPAAGDSWQRQRSLAGFARRRRGSHDAPDRRPGSTGRADAPGARGTARAPRSDSQGGASRQLQLELGGLSAGGFPAGGPDLGRPAELLWPSVARRARPPRSARNPHSEDRPRWDAPARLEGPATLSPCSP